MGKKKTGKARRREDGYGGGGSIPVQRFRHGGGNANKPKPRRNKQQPLLLSERSFHTQQEDHCETPLQAFKDLEPLLCSIAKKLNKKKSHLAIYDPFYCEGSMRQHLQALGFEDVYNKKEDFYEVQRRGEVPEHDVLVTNPPFSGDHIERLFQFCLRSNQRRPFFLLLPQFVATKQYFSSVFPKQAPMFYLLPSKPYQFWAPGREQEGIRGRFVVPKAHGKEFQCFWYNCLNTSREESERHVKWLNKTKNRQKMTGNAAGGGGGGGNFQPATWTIARDVNELPNTFKTKKRLNPRQRAKLKLQRAKQTR